MVFIVAAILFFTSMIHNCTYTPQGEVVARKQRLHMLCVRVCGVKSSRAAKGSGGDECKAEK